MIDLIDTVKNTPLAEVWLMNYDTYRYRHRRIQEMFGKDYLRHIPVGSLHHCLSMCRDGKVWDQERQSDSVEGFIKNDYAPPIVYRQPVA